MEQPLLLVSLVIGALGWCGAVGLTKLPRNLPPLPPRERAFWWLAVAVAAGVLCVTLPSKPPFAPGSALGTGFIFGTVLLLASARVRSRDSVAAPSAFFCGGILATGVPLALSTGHTIPVDELFGVALGQAVTALILIIAAGERTVWARAVLAGAAFGVATASAVSLGLLHEQISNGALPEPTATSWSMAGLAIAALVALTALIGDISASKLGGIDGLWGRVGDLIWGEAAPNRTAGLLIALIFGLLGAAVLALRVLDEPGLGVIFALGELAGLLILILTREGATEGRIGSNAPVGALVLLASFMAAYATLQGYGGAILVLGAVLPIGFAPTPRILPALKIVLLGLALCWYRLFMSHYWGDFPGTGFSDSYALFGVLAGSLLPSLPVLLAKDGENASVPRLLGAGVAALVGPIVLIMFYGAAVGPALMVGLALACTLRGGTCAALWSVIVGIAVVEGTHLLLPAADLSRTERVHLVLLVGLGGAVLLITSEVAARLSSRRKSL